MATWHLSIDYFIWPCVVNRTILSHPNPQTSGYVTLCVKMNFACMIKLRILKWENYQGLFGWAQCNHNSFYKTEAGSIRIRKSEVTEETGRLENAMWLALKMEKGSLNQGIQVASKSLKRQANILPRVSRKDHNLAGTLILACWGQFWISDL